MHQHLINRFNNFNFIHAPIITESPTINITTLLQLKFFNSSNHHYKPPHEINCRLHVEIGDWRIQLPNYLFTNIHISKPLACAFILWTPNWRYRPSKISFKVNIFCRLRIEHQHSAFKIKLQDLRFKHCWRINQSSISTTFYFQAAFTSFYIFYTFEFDMN